MKIKDRPEFTKKGKPLTFPPNATVAEAVREMSEKNYGAAIVVNGDESVAGVVTERDFMRRLLDKGRDPKETTLADIMTKDVRCARADDDLIDWLRIMSNERFRHLPVVDEDNRLVSMMSQGDFVSYTWPELIYRVKQTAQASLGPRWNIVLIAAAVMLYALAVPLVNSLLS